MICSDDYEIEYRKIHSKCADSMGYEPYVPSNAILSSIIFKYVYISVSLCEFVHVTTVAMEVRKGHGMPRN